MAARRPAPSDPVALRRKVALVAVLAAVLASFVLAEWFDRGFLIPDPTTWEKGRILTSSYDPPTRPVELFLNQGDGQVYAHGAQDPFVRHPEGIYGSADEHAYRLMRPLLGWTGWITSLGRPRSVAWALVAAMIWGAALLGAVAAALAARLGRDPLAGLVLLAAPGMLVDVRLVGPETLGTALVGLGLLALWSSPPRRWWAVAAFGAAGLARESLLLVPLVLALVAVWEARAEGRSASLRAAWPLALTAVPFVAWVLAVRGLTGGWPLGSEGEGRLTLVPFGGLVGGIDRWGVAEWLSALLVLVPAVAALVVSGDRRLRALVVAHLAYAATFGEVVWFTWVGFGRILLPLSLVTLLALLAGRDRVPWSTPEPGSLQP